MSKVIVLDSMGCQIWAGTEFALKEYTRQMSWAQPSAWLRDRGYVLITEDDLATLPVTEEEVQQAKGNLDHALEEYGKCLTKIAELREQLEEPEGYAVVCDKQIDDLTEFHAKRKALSLRKKNAGN